MKSKKQNYCMLCGWNVKMCGYNLCGEIGMVSYKDLLKNRRSVRDYENKDVSTDTGNGCLNCRFPIIL